MPRAALFHAADRPIELHSFETPEPVGGEILVRVACCTLCRSDLHTRSGRRIEPTPTVLGHEIVGRIEAMGPDAPKVDRRGDPLGIGDRVTWAINVGCGSCFYCHDDLPQKCERPRKYGHERVTLDRPLSGGLSDLTLLAPGTAVFRVPDAIPDGVAAMANCGVATAAATLRAAGPVAGRAVVVMGAGILGSSAAAMARAAGASAVIVADPSPASRERASAFGATHAADPADLLPILRDVSSGRGADVVIEMSGAAAAVAAAIALGRIGGTVVLAGSVAPVAEVAVAPERLVRGMLTIRGIHNYHPRDLDAALTFLAAHGQPFAPLIGAEYPLEAVDTAFAHAEASPGLRIAVRPGCERLW